MKIYKNKLFLSFFGIGAVLILMIVFFIVPSIQQIIQMNNEITQQRLDLEKKSSLGLNIKNTKADLKEIEDNIFQLDSFFIKPGEELSFISSMETLGIKNGIKLTINPKFPGQDIGGRIKAIPLQISAEGPYDQIQKFLLDLEALPYYYNISSISQSGSSGDISIQLNGDIYSLK